MKNRTNSPLPLWPTIVAAIFLAASVLMAAPPDLTSGGTPDTSRTINLGPTGMRGWVYHVNGSGKTADTSESRQILVNSVDQGSPAAGKLAEGDVILGAEGTGGNPVAFTSDARKGLAFAIAEAEARNPATLKVLRWRSGTTSVVDLTLRTMGAYSATAPYECPKSAKILTEGAQWVFQNESSGRYSFGGLSLLATGNEAYLSRVRNEARALVPGTSKRAEMMADTRDATSMVTWERGHTLIFLAEYYLASGDAQVLPGIEAYAVNIAKNSSLFGTVGHIFAEKNSDGTANGPMGGVYGPVNSSGMPCFLGLLLARECGLTHPEIEAAIDRSSLFFASYSGRGSIPYGEHEPGTSHEGNGRSGLAALCFSLQDQRVEAGKFFAKMATAAPSEREKGHTGAFFNYLWAPLGAAVGGEAAAAEHFKRISWHLDLSRRWDGSFVYDCLNGEGPHSGSSYNSFRMSTAALLVYALPLRQLHLTGRNHDPNFLLSATEVAEAAEADDYQVTSRSKAELISDTASWSPKIRRQAAIELKARGVSNAERDQLHALATDSSRPAYARAGACDALGRIGNSSSASVLASLLNDPENYVRYGAAEALRYLPSSAQRTVLPQVLIATVETAKPWYPIDEEDPLQFAHGRLCALLFYGGNAYGPKGIIWNNLAGVDRNLLYPAIRATAGSPLGFTRNHLQWTYPMLSQEDMLGVADAVVDSVREFAPSDRMFAFSVRQKGFDLLEKFSIAEGVPAGLRYVIETKAGDRTKALQTLERYAASYTTVTPQPDVITAVTRFLNATGGNSAQNQAVSEAAQEVLDAIAADTQPRSLVPLKTISSVVADDPVLSGPANNSTTLRVTAFDYAKGDSIFTWKKIAGPGEVVFSPNGTAEAAICTVQLDGTPGDYEFEVTMSDSRGLTEATSSVPLKLNSVKTPLKVFILAGQSNMEGHGEINPPTTQGTLEYLVANDPATYGHLKNGASWAVRDDAWISYRRAGTTLVKGDLTVGFGERSSLIGPELQFGHVMADLNEGPILIIKTAWGGKSLAVDFRPPSSGWSVNPPVAAGDQGFYYQEMINEVNQVLANLATDFPDYDPADGYELAGFGWHQGWNDRVNQGYNDQYEVNMANFINDVRNDLGQPNLPFVIATTGMSGWSEAHPRALSLMRAQLAMADEMKYPAFEGNVAVVDTRDFYRDGSVSPSNQGFHWNRNAETYFLIGQAMAQELAALTPETEDTTPPLVSSLSDDKSGGPIFVGDTVTYTVTFNEPMNPATVNPSDFENLSPVAIVVESVTPTSSPTTFEVQVTATELGSLQLRIAGDATLADLAGNQLVTASANPDETIIAVIMESEPETPRGEIVIDGSAWWKDQEKGVFTGTFDASGSDKLVVIVTGEHGFNNAAGTVNSVTYDGVPLTPVIQRNAQVSGTDTLYNHLWILDQPATAAGQITVEVENRGSVTAFALSGTLPGVGATAVSENNTRSVELTTTASKSLVIASFGMGGAGNTANVDAVTPDAPLNFVVAQKNGGSRNWDGHVIAHAEVPSIGTATYGFTGGNELGAHVIAAEFLAAGVTADDAFTSWAGNFEALSDPNPSLDFDGGGLPTGIEWVVGGDPTDPRDDAALAPTGTTNESYLIFNYQRTDLANNDPNTTIMVEYGNDLIGWTTAVDGLDGIVITETDSAPIAEVEVRIPLTLAEPGKALFARLKAVITRP